MPLGSLISAGASLIGGLFGKSSADANRASQEAMAANNIALQREFAQQGVRWKVEDARKAGINPLAAMGMPSQSFTPVSIGNTADTSMQTALTNMGQDVGRAVNATRTADERINALAASKLQLEGMELDNDIKRASLASSLQKLGANNNPPLPGTVFPVETDKPDKSKPLMLLGNRWDTNPNTSPTKSAEDEYGDEVGGVFWGLTKLMNDAYLNLKNKFSRDMERGRAERRGSSGSYW